VRRGRCSSPGRCSSGPASRCPSPSDWSFELIAQYHEAIRATAERFGLDTYANQLEIISAEQMMDAYASVGMPVNYRHWSFGKEFISTQQHYQRGQMGLAYEIVINSNPCISYLMEENTLAMQALVIAHAAYGHNSFFKGNYLFRMWTDAASIIDYLVYAQQYIARCEEQQGLDAVEALLDSCHALMNHGVDRYRRPAKLSLTEELPAREEREAYRSARSTTCGAPCRAAGDKTGRRRPPLPRGAAGEPAVLHREERPAARALAAREWCASCARSPSTSTRSARPRS
jgi:stage V sporulation protein R